ncbi:MAG: histidinol-phosphate transaminase [Candidatus Caldatribacteriota bacterium]|nr:histidinol-phosphate transaminase [Candidatus Caldatribacteriota bacterium]
MKKDKKYYRDSLRELKPYDPHEVPYKIKLNANENPYSLPEEIIEEILRKAKNLEYSHYPNANSEKLSEIVSSFWGLNRDNIVIGNGSDELIDYLIKAFSEKGRRLITTAPSFAMYKIYSIVNGANFVQIPLSQSDFSLNVDKILEEAKKEDSSVVFIAYPNAPTGNYFAEEKIIKIIEESGCLIVVDEAYFEFGEKTFVPLISRYNNLVILRTFSKAYSLAGLRVGYLLSNPEIINEVRKVKSPFNVNTFSQLAAQVVFENKEILKDSIKKIVEEREKLINRINELPPFKAHPSRTNFVLVEVGSKENTDLVYNGLLEQGILVQTVSDPVFSTSRYFLRITVGNREENDILLEKLENISKNLSLSTF